MDDADVSWSQAGPSAPRSRRRDEPGPTFVIEPAVAPARHGLVDSGIMEELGVVEGVDGSPRHACVDSRPEDGVPLLLVHGNLVTGGWWRYVAAALPDDVRVIAPDRAASGGARPSRSMPPAVWVTWWTTSARCWSRWAWADAGRGQRGRLVDGWRAAVAVRGRVPGRPRLDDDDRPGLALRVRRDQGAATAPCFDDFAGSAGAGPLPNSFADWPRATARRTTRRRARGSSCASAPAHARTPENVDEEFLLDEPPAMMGRGLLSRGLDTVGELARVGPGNPGVLNAMTPKSTGPRTSSIWRGNRRSPGCGAGRTRSSPTPRSSTSAILGQIGAVPGWPGDAAPPQPMAGQTRAVLDAYRAGGGVAEEITLLITRRTACRWRCPSAWPR